MLNDPLAGRGIRAPECSRLLIATEDGVFLWPGTPLVYRQGNGFFTADPRAVNSAIGSLLGPAALDLPLQPLLERARDGLRNHQIDAVQDALAKLRLPPVSANGARLMRAIADRQGLILPVFAVATREDATPWKEREIATFAGLYDNARVRARDLSKVFNPGALNPRSLWDPDQHPRHPAGDSDGGEFAPNGGDSSSVIPIAGPKPPWHNNPPERLSDPPEITKTEPKTDTEKFLVIRKTAYWIGWAARFGLRNAPQTKAFIAAAEGAAWMWPYVSAYLQGPKTLEQLQADGKSPAEGYDIHHIVEQTPARNQGFSEAQIESPRNKVRIPTIKHWELNAWYNRVNPDYENMTPREYLKGKSWYVRRAVGLDGLQKVGVLK